MSLVYFLLSVALILKSFAKALIHNSSSSPSASEKQPEASIQSLPCTLFQVVVEEDDTSNSGHHRDNIIWRCQLQGQDLGILNSGDENRTSGFVDVEGMDWVLSAKTDIQSGITTLLADGAILQNKKIVIQPNQHMLFGKTKAFLNCAHVVSRTGPQSRQSQVPHDFTRTTGTKTVLAVRVKTLDAEPTATAGRIADDIFGIDGDLVNLKSQMEGCSYSKLKIQPASTNGVGCRDNSNFTFFRTFGDGSVGNCGHFEKRHDTIDYCLANGNEPDPGGMTANAACCVCGGGITWYYSRREIQNGVIQIQLDLSVADSDSFALEEEAVKVLESTFGGNKLFTMFDHVMVCLPPGTNMYGSPSWRAYAYVNHYLSVYHDTWCNYPKTSVHEIAHNFGLAHSWISLQEGQEETVMGRGYPVDEGPMRAQVCFNPAKSYQLGWYQDKVMELDPTKPTWQGTLIGVANYHSLRKDAMVIIKIPAEKEDLYVGYNHAIRHHRGTFYGANKVKIVRQGQNFAESWMEKVLDSGEAHVVPNYQGDSQHLTIQVLETNGYPDGYAEVNIFTFETDGFCVDNSDFKVKFNSTIGTVPCWWFRDNEPIGCPGFGNSKGSCADGAGCTARFECCHCGGGRRTALPPSNAPTMMPSKDVVASPAGRRNGLPDLLVVSFLGLSSFFFMI